MALRSWVAMVATVLFSQRSSCSFVCNTSSRAGRAQYAKAGGQAPPPQPPRSSLPSQVFISWNLRWKAGICLSAEFLLALTLLCNA